VASWPLRNRPEPLEQESGHTIDVADLQKKKKKKSAFVIRSGPLSLPIIVLPIAMVVTVSQDALSTFSKLSGVYTCIGFRILVVHGDVSSHKPFITSQDESYITLMREKDIVYRPVTEVIRWHDRSPQQRVPLTSIILHRFYQCARIVRVMVDGTL
jgi:hypothetical protein